MANKVIQARAHPRLHGAVLKLPDGRMVNATNSSGVRLPPNAAVQVLDLGDGKYTVIGRER